MSFADFLFCMAVVIAMLTGIVLGLGINDAPGWYVWAKGWQTLFAGILAVAAAVMTIYQMRIAAALEAQRHRELIDLTNRPDRLKARRAAEEAADYPAYCNTLPDWVAPADDLFLAASVRVNHVEDWLAVMVERLGNRLVTDAVVLFDADLSQVWEGVHYRQNELRRQAAQMTATLNRGDRVGVIENMDLLAGNVDGFKEQVIRFSEGLQNLRRQYELQGSTVQ